MSVIIKSIFNSSLVPALQMHCAENSNQIFPEMKLHSLVSIFTFMYLWGIYIYPTIGHISLGHTNLFVNLRY
jgi:hypothetical protein